MIVCLGWGSLIWDQKELEINSEWKEDGPDVAIEFARQSQDGRLTLVIEPSARKVKVLWTKMAATSLDDAIENLKKREGTITRLIGSWKKGADDPIQIAGLSSWAKSIGASAVIWTALPSKFHNKNEVAPTIEEALVYLKSLDEKEFELAKTYITNAPTQIKTDYRKAFELEFGW